MVDGIEKWTPPGHKGADKRDLVFDSQLEFILPGSIANDREQMVVLEVCYDDDENSCQRELCSRVRARVRVMIRMRHSVKFCT
jgi:hypothetical protein